MTKTFLRAACVGIAFLAGGCGSSHHDDAAPAQQEDAAASGSVAGLVGFAQAQIARTDDSSEPRPVAGIHPPVSEVDEPAVI
jgi:hypothetical protein